MDNTGCGFQSPNPSRCKMCCFNFFFEFASANTKLLLILIIITGSFTFVYWFILVTLIFAEFREKRWTDDWSQKDTVAFFLIALIIWVFLMFLIAAVWYYCSRNVFKPGEKMENTPIIAKECDKLEHINEKVQDTLGIQENLDKISKNVMRQSMSHWEKVKKDVNKLELRKSTITPLPEYSPEAKNNIFTFSPDDTNEENKRASSPFREYLHLVQIESPTSPTLSLEDECMKTLEEFGKEEGGQISTESDLEDLEDAFDEIIPEDEEKSQKRPKSCIYDVPKKIKSIDSLNDSVLAEETVNRRTYKVNPDEIFTMDEDLVTMRDADNNQKHPAESFVEREKEFTPANSNSSIEEEEKHPSEIQDTIEQELTPDNTEIKDQVKTDHPAKIFDIKEKEMAPDECVDAKKGHPAGVFTRKEKELTREVITSGDGDTQEKEFTQEDNSDGMEDEHPARTFVKKEKELTRNDIVNREEGEEDNQSKCDDEGKKSDHGDFDGEHPARIFDNKEKELTRANSDELGIEHPTRIFAKKEADLKQEGSLKSRDSHPQVKDKVTKNKDMGNKSEHPGRTFDRQEKELDRESAFSSKDHETEHPASIFARKEKDLIESERDSESNEDNLAKVLDRSEKELTLQDSVEDSKIKDTQPKKKFGRKESKMFLGEIGKTGSVLSELHVDVSPEGRLLTETAVVMGRCEVLTTSPETKDI